MPPSGTGSPAASEAPGSSPPPEGPPRARPDLALAIGFVLAFALGAAVRLILLPTDGLRGDLDQFVGWVHHIAIRGPGSLYAGTDAGPVTFGPVMAYVWTALSVVQPAFATATDASDVAIRSLMKLPASLADLGLAAVAGYALRDRGAWALAAVVAILAHPAVIDVSAWWGQYESIFVLSGLAAAVSAARGRNGLAAALVAISLMTKPQAAAFIIPFAAWFWATGGVRGLLRAGAIGIAVSVLLWLPFIPAGGPVDYLRNLATYQNEIFNVLSLRAWNAWWLVQEAGAGGSFVADDIAIAGPITLRHVGFAITGVVSLAIAAAIVRDPRPRTLLLGLSASVLVFFAVMTQMHERYAFAALILLVPLLPERRILGLWLAFGVVFTLNLLAAVPPTPGIGEALPVAGLLGIGGSIAMLVMTGLALAWLRPRPAA